MPKHDFTAENPPPHKTLAQFDVNVCETLLEEPQLWDSVSLCELILQQI